MSPAAVDRLLRLGGAVALAALLTAPWYAIGIPLHAPFPVATSGTVTGWSTLATVVRGLAAGTIAAVVVGELLISRAAPAIRLLATVTTLAVGYEVLIHPPSSARVDSPLICAYLGLVACAAIAIGARTPPQK
jgi:hypothetical protein